MRIQQIDNSFSLAQTVLWQYDHAPNLIGMFAGMANELKMEVTDFWDWFEKNVGSLDGNLDAGEDSALFGLNVWGITLGVPRPYIPHGQITSDASVDDDGNPVYALSNDVYRRLLKARVYMLDADADTASFAEGLRIAFEGRVACVDGSDGSPQTPMVMFYANNLGEDSVTFRCYTGADGIELYTTSSSPSDGDPMLRDNGGVFTDAGVSYDSETMVRDEDGDVQSVYAIEPYRAEPAPPNQGATDEEIAEYNVRMEEYDLLSNPDLIESVFNYPAGVKTDGEVVSTEYAIGLNDDQYNGQKLRNFAPKHADVVDDSVNGGQFAITEEGE